MHATEQTATQKTPDDPARDLGQRGVGLGFRSCEEHEAFVLGFYKKTIEELLQWKDTESYRNAPFAVQEAVCLEVLRLKRLVGGA